MYKKLILLFFIFIVLFFIAFFKECKFETNLIRTLLPENIINSSDIVSVANKSSSIIKIVFEGGETQKKEFLEKIDKNIFEINKIDFSPLFEIYKKNYGNFLSETDRNLLKRKEYDKLYENAINQMYNPFGIQFVPFDKDPYFFNTNFLISNNIAKNADEKLVSIELNIKKENGLEPDKINNEISKLIKIKLSDNKSKIYFAGTPIHSYFTSRNAKIFINVISILSLLFICGITYFYFHNINLIIPILCSIGFGILSGFCAVKILFNNFQIITLLFSTTLIGFGIDYSYHYLFHETKDKIFIKNLTYSFITTIIPFLIFFITGIELLKQIAVFSIFGLFAIYIFVIIFYPIFNLSSTPQKLNVNYKVCKILFSILIILSVLGYLRLNFNDSLDSLYIPSKVLLKSEKMYEKSVGIKNNELQFITVKGSGIEDIMEKEEKISKILDNNKIKYASISKFFPSEKKQKENINLVKDIYKTNLNKFGNILSAKQIKNIQKQEYKILYPPKIKEFLLNENTSLMYIFSSKNLDIKENGITTINIKKDTEKYLKNYRIKLLAIFPVIVSFILITLGILFGLKDGVKIFLPSIIGIFTALGITSLIYGEINLFGLIALFLVMGFTTDYSVFRNEDSKKNEDAVFISSITTAFSFLLLSLTSFKLLSSISIILFIGIIGAYLSGKIIYKEGEKD